MTEALLVPPPAFAFTAIPGGFAPIESVVTVAFPAIRFPDGTAMTTDHYAGAFALFNRVVAPGAAAQVWDAVVNTWRPAGESDLARTGLPLLPPVEGIEPWRAILVPSAQRDASGSPMFASATGGFPQYRIRGLFRARRESAVAVGLGPEGPALRFASGIAQVGTLTIEADGDIRLSPAAGRRVVITSDLEVERVRYLPASGLPKKTLS
jgi:hypothetical protein